MRTVTGRTLQRRQENPDESAVQDDFLPILQNMLKELGRAPTPGRKAKIYLKAVLVFYALVLYWYAVYELLGYMVIQRVVSRLQKGSRAPKAAIDDAEETVSESKVRMREKMIEGWTTFCVGQFYFLASVCVLIIWQEFTCRKHVLEEEDRAPMLQNMDAPFERQAPPQALAPIANANSIECEEGPASPALSLRRTGQHHCCAQARRGWRTPPMRVLQWNLSCTLGVVAWMGIDLTCDAIHILIQGLDKTNARLGINFAFIIVANVIVITLNQIDTEEDQQRRGQRATLPRRVREAGRRENGALLGEEQTEDGAEEAGGEERLHKRGGSMELVLQTVADMSESMSGEKGAQARFSRLAAGEALAPGEQEGAARTEKR